MARAVPYIGGEIPIFCLAHRSDLNLRVVLKSGFLQMESKKGRYQKGYLLCIHISPIHTHIYASSTWLIHHQLNNINTMMYYDNINNIRYQINQTHHQSWMPNIFYLADEVMHVMLISKIISPKDRLLEPFIFGWFGGTPLLRNTSNSWDVKRPDYEGTNLPKSLFFRQQNWLCELATSKEALQ